MPLRSNPDNSDVITGANRSVSQGRPRWLHHQHLIRIDDALIDQRHTVVSHAYVSLGAIINSRSQLKSVNLK